MDKRQTDRHAMQSEVGYLFSGLWRGKEEGEKSREAERDTERERDREERDLSCLFEREKEREETPATSRKEDLPASVDGGGSGLSVKETEQIITHKPEGSSFKKPGTPFPPIGDP